MVAKPAPIVRPNASPTFLPSDGSQREGSGHESYMGILSKHWAYSALVFEEFVQIVVLLSAMSYWLKEEGSRESVMNRSRAVTNDFSVFLVIFSIFP